MMNGSDKMNNAGDTADALANFTFACPHCGQHLEAEPDWVGMECECPSCGKAIIVPASPARNPMITVMTKPKLQPVSGPVSMNGGNPSWWKMIPKWLYGVACAAVVGIIVLVFALIISIKLLSSNGARRVDTEKSVATTNDGKKDGKPAPLPRPDIKPLQKDRESTQWVKACEEAAWKVVMRFPDKNKGKPFYIVGKITNVIPPDPKANNHRGNIWIEQDGDWKATWVIVYDDERTILPNGNMLRGDEVSVFGTFEKIVKRTVLDDNPMLIARLISTDDPDDVMESYEEEDDKGVEKASTYRTSSSATPNPTESEKMAMGRVFYVYAKQEIMMSQLTSAGQNDGEASMAAQFFAGLGSLGILNEVDTEGCPSDFAEAWKGFAAGVGGLKVIESGYNLMDALRQQAEANGQFVDFETKQKLSELKQKLPEARKECKEKMEAFSAVCRRYGLDNLQKWSLEAYKRYEGNPNAKLFKSDR